MWATGGADRWIGLDGAVNARDVGGLSTSDGRVVVRNRLVRADNLQDLSGSDVRLLVDRIGVRDVVDLRTATERRLEGPAPLDTEPDVTVHHLSLHPDNEEDSADGTSTVTELEGDVVLPWQRADAAQHPERSATSAYLNYLRDRPDSIVAALRAVADSDGAVVIHCAAGKDRTGVVVALALHLVGVDRCTIVEDYLLTADRIEVIMDRLARSRTYGDELRGRPLSSHLPRPEALHQVFAALEGDQGGPESWLAAHGWSAADTIRLRRRLVDPCVIGSEGGGARDA